MASGQEPEEQATRTLPADKVLTDHNGEIGYYVKKGSEFVPVTNFSVNCVGYVAETPQSGSSEGFLFNVFPKTSIVSGAEDDAADPVSRQQYYLTWRDMSTQQGILSKFASKKLWTVPSKDQYLPAYFKRLCDEYVNVGSPRRVFPVECHGLQRGSSPPTWVIGSNLHVVLHDDRADRIHERMSPYAVLGDEVSQLPIVDIIEDESLLDAGVALRELILIQEKYLGENFAATLLILGGMGLAIHYEQLGSLYEGVPLVMAYGSPVSGKSLAVEMAMSLLSIRESIGECTPVGILKMATSQTLPFWWDDVSDFGILEHLVVQTFNQSQRKTAREEGHVLPRTVPIVTMNPQCLNSKKKIDKEKVSRVFSRIAVIPFAKVTKRQTLESCLNLRAELKPVLEKTVLSVGNLIELRSSFETMREDALFKEICSLMMDSLLDMRSQMNYALLLYSTGKILEKLQLKDKYFGTVKSFFSETLAPRHVQLLDPEFTGELGSDSNVDYNEEEISELMALVNRIVEKCTADPEKTKEFFIPRTSVSKCKCGDVLGFKVDKALQFVGEKGKEQMLKRFITKTGKGCAGRLTFPERGQVSGCLHIKKTLFPGPMLISIDEAFPQPSSKRQTNQVPEKVSEEDNTEVEEVDLTETCSTENTDDQTNDNDDELLSRSTQVFESLNGLSSATGTQKASGTSSSQHCNQDVVDKLRLDEEIWRRAAERESRDPCESNPKRRKGTVRDEASNLVDGIHPGIMQRKLRSRK